MEIFGLIVFASLFVFSGFNHIRNHAGTTGYTASVLPAPLKPLAFLGGAPVGVALIAGSVGAVYNNSSAFAYGLAGFLIVATLMFHRAELIKLSPDALKNVALMGAAVYIASQVV